MIGHFLQGCTTVIRIEKKDFFVILNKELYKIPVAFEKCMLLTDML